MNRLEREDEDGARAAVPRGGSGRLGRVGASLPASRVCDCAPRRTGLDEHAAADGFQTARLLQSLQALREPRRLQAWIVPTAKRQALLERRRGARHVSLAPADADDDAAPEWDLPGEGPLPDAQLDELQHMHRLRLAFERLDPRCRALLGALFRDDEPPAYEAIALQLDMPVGSIAPTRARCLDKLRRSTRAAVPRQQQRVAIGQSVAKAWMIGQLPAVAPASHWHSRACSALRIAFRSASFS